MIEARASKGRFESFSDFCRKVDPSVLTKRVLESLILAGAFDSLGYRRRALLDRAGQGVRPDRRRAQGGGRRAVLAVRRRRGGRARSTSPCSPARSSTSRSSSASRRRCSAQFVSDHPLLEVADDLRAQSTHEIGDLEARGRRRAGDGRRDHRRCLEEVHEARGAVRAVPSRGPRGRGGRRRVPVGLRGRSGPDRGGPDRAGRRADRPARAGAPDPGERRAASRSSSGIVPPGGGESVVIDLTAAACTDAVLAKMAELLRSRPGPAPVRVRFHSTDGVRPLDMGEFRVDSSAALMGELDGPAGHRRRPRGTRRLTPPGPPEAQAHRRPSIVLAVFEVMPAIDVSDGALAHVHAGRPASDRGVRRGPARRGGRRRSRPAPRGSTSWTWTSRSKARLGTSRCVSAIASLRVAVQAAGGVRTADEVRRAARRRAPPGSSSGRRRCADEPRDDRAALGGKGRASSSGSRSAATVGSARAAATPSTCR